MTMKDECPAENSAAVFRDAAGGIAREAGALLGERFTGRRAADARAKSPRNIVTEADLAAERLIRSLLEARFPGHGIIGEEYAPREGTGVSWYVDPLDGTTNFAAGIPHWAVSIGAVDAAGPLAGAVYDPIRDELFLAGRGLGATLNGSPLAVSAARDLEESLVATGFASMRGHDPDHACLDRFAAAIVRVKGVRRLGSAALDLAYVASGRFEIFFEEALSGWDTAAGALLVSEAGGVVLDYRGGDDWLTGGSILAGAPAIVRAFLADVPGFG